VRTCGSIFLPMVGMVVTISPSFNLYRIVVLPAASRPTMRMRISCLEKSLWNSLVKVSPIAAAGWEEKVTRFFLSFSPSPSWTKNHKRYQVAKRMSGTTDLARNAHEETHSAKATRNKRAAKRSALVCSERTRGRWRRRSTLTAHSR